MPLLSLNEAAELARTSRSSLFRAVKAGRVSAHRNDAGELRLDPSEVLRAYGDGNASGRADLIDQGSVRLVIGKPARTVEDRKPAIGVCVNAHIRLDEVAAVALLGDLQHATRVAHRVVVPHHALIL